MSFTHITFEAGEARMDWLGLCAAFDAGHRLPKAEIADSFLYRTPDTLLSRAAWIDGLGVAVKSATIFPGNAEAGKPVVGGVVNLLSDTDGSLEAVIDFHLVTKWKTAGDSLCAALKLAPPKVSRILIVGAGAVAQSLREAYGAGFPEASFAVWNRTGTRAHDLAERYPGMEVETDLGEAVASADIVTCATMSTDPVIRGSWLRPDQHIDLIGAYRPDMREADDVALKRARIFVDSYDTTIGHIGELKIPLAGGAITREDVLADYYQPAAFTRAPGDITLFKNGGGAHLDLMTSRYILDLVRGAA
ncbi:ornithine cyclodeaminase family protein [Mesobacterium pallidum]|uniref:ornithine cyclodeaminase family protein n=1 Tax=Mesobacterium pallidum TaxID=2872037 RepID=UPI001EE1B363|nr:ornithine cyclodeaminase [Mesobacterium pallidum]